MRVRRFTSSLAVALALALPVSARGDEMLHYRWHLEGFLGAIASLFVPSGGEGTLSLHATERSTLESELLITSPDSASGEFFRYGAEWEPESGRSLRAWSDYRWRGENKSKQSEIDQVGVVDIVSAIYLLRLDPPLSPRRLEIWSDGRLYPVVVIPRGEENRRVAGQTVQSRHYSVRGIDLPDRRQWKGELDLWIAQSRHATPVEILVTRKGARVRLELTALPDPASPPGVEAPAP